MAEIAACYIWALKRAVVTIAAAISAFGVAILILLFGPFAELRVAPVVNEWAIVDARRDGDMLSWRVRVDKRRGCSPETRWLARWGSEAASLRVNGPAGNPYQDGLAIEAGERVTVGPFTAPVPRGWEHADAIRIDAVVTYSCGLPWRLPPLHAAEAIAK